MWADVKGRGLTTKEVTTMAQNKGAIVRYRALDRCLQSKNVRYYLEDLIKACNEALYDAFFERMTVSRRQIYLDLNHMESFAGYRADIERHHDGKRIYYRYAAPDFSIDKMPISPEEMDQLKETILMLNRFKGMPHFEWMEELLSKLEDKFHLKSADDSVIGFEQNLDLKGLENITPLFEAIINHQVLNIRYKSFKKNKPITCEVHPYYLKQYNNRWFLFGWNTEFGAITNFALDRIEAVSHMLGEYRPKPADLDFDEYFDDVVGVTIPKAKVEHIVMRVASDRYPYIKNKPLHPSQHNYDREFRVTIDVIPNNELIALLLSFGSQLEVLEPQSVREMMRDHVKTLNKFYR